MKNPAYFIVSQDRNIHQKWCSWMVIPQINWRVNSDLLLNTLCILHHTKVIIWPIWCSEWKNTKVQGQNIQHRTYNTEHGLQYQWHSQLKNSMSRLQYEPTFKTPLRHIQRGWHHGVTSQDVPESNASDDENINILRQHEVALMSTLS